MSVAWGIALIVAGEVVEHNDWFGEDFGAALKIAGAAVAIGGMTGGESAAGAGTTTTETASVVGAEGTTGATATQIGAADAGAAIGSGVSDAAVAESLSLGAGETAAAAAAPEWSMVSAVPAEGAATSTGVMAAPASEGMLGTASAAPTAAAPEAAAATPWYEGPYAMPATMIGGQVISGAYGAKKQEEMEKRREAEEERKYQRGAAWGRERSGRSIPLDFGKGLTEMSSRFFRDREQKRGGLLS